MEIIKISNHEIREIGGGTQCKHHMLIGFPEINTLGVVLLQGTSFIQEVFPVF